jgi:hypothetical protein
MLKAETNSSQGAVAKVRPIKPGRLRLQPNCR